MTTAQSPNVPASECPASPQRSRRVLAKALGLVAAACALALIANLVSPRRIAWFEDWNAGVEARAWKAGLKVVSVRDTAELVRNRVAVLDARSVAEYDKGHLPQAMSVPFKDAARTLQDLEPILKRDGVIVVYCRSSECDEALMLCEALRDQGYRELRLFAGGWEAWSAAGQDIERGGA